MNAHQKPSRFLPTSEAATRIFSVAPATYRVHAMHGSERHWQQTNCYADLWIEVLNALGTSPEAAFGFTVGQDFEGDQFTFFKPPLEDLEVLYGVRTTELALYDDLIQHLQMQASRRRLVLIELDSFYLPDTRGVSYRETHGKTTIGINRLDLQARELDYFHNDGLFHVAGEDFEGLFRLLPGQMNEETLFPYAEMVKLPDRIPEEVALRDTARNLLARHMTWVPKNNPIERYRAVAASQAEALIEREPLAFHSYAFNTLRQLGANFELLATHLNWLGSVFDGPASHALQLGAGAKIAQFNLARGLRTKTFERFDEALGELATHYDAVMAGLRIAIRS